MKPGVLMMNKSLIAVLVVIGLAGAGGAAWWFLGKQPEQLVVKPAKPVTVFQDCPECPEMVEIPPGEFMMGSPTSEPGRSDDEGPVHRVTIPSAFAVGKYEVTFDEWDACATAGGCSHKPEAGQSWKTVSGRGREPVVRVKWDDAQEYVSWLSKKTGKKYRLLSEAEWEYVARAGTTTPFHTGETISASEAKFRGGPDGPVPVGSFGANQFGLHDVHGNVGELVEDCWDYEKSSLEGYKGAPSDGSAIGSDILECSDRICRGGNWAFVPEALRSARRDPCWHRTKANGFRVARALP
jgi:formylglycine-generating enzyme required for sulfatase activity